MGEEWGAATPFQFFSFMPDAGLREAVRSGRYGEFAEHGWDEVDVPDPNDEQTFRRSQLDWSEPGTEPHATLLHVYRELIALRKCHPELSDPRLDALTVDVDERTRTLVLHRGALRVVVNLSAQPATVGLDGQPTQVLLASGQATTAQDTVRLEGESFAVVALQLSGRACATTTAR
jgi:maltooligosyltrehalose trehalohydrolase